MVKRIQFLILFLVVGGCIEPYQFTIKNNEPSLVVEGYISDKSYQETLSYPSDGEYFIVKLTSTSDVTNVRSKPVLSAGVRLISDAGERWEYTEVGDESGIYRLLDENFKASVGVSYKLQIEVPNDDVYESEWESIPTTSVPAMRDIEFSETNLQRYKIELGEQVIVTVQGIKAQIDLPENSSGEPVYYRWMFRPTWKYVAPLSPSIVLPGHSCWITSPYYLNNYAIQQDNVGGYKKELFFIETVRNERIFEKFSALIVQHAMSESYYTFWREMKEQNEGGAIFGKPPFNLTTNMRSLGGEKKVSGYFSVVQEQAKRWFFKKEDLSYFVENTLKRDCTVPFQDPAPECFNCMEYSHGLPTNEKPVWWVD
jgi:hypothetical protein